MKIHISLFRKIIFSVVSILVILACNRDNLNDYMDTSTGTVALKINLGSSFTGGTGALSPWAHALQEAIDLTITSTTSTFTQTITFNPNDPSTLPTTTLPYDSYVWSISNSGEAIPVASTLYVYGSSAAPFSVGSATTILPLILDTDFALVTVTTTNIGAVTVTQNAVETELTTQDNYYYGYINSLFTDYSIAITSSDGMGATSLIAAPIAKTHYNYILNYDYLSTLEVTLELTDTFILEDMPVDMVNIDSDGDGVFDSVDQCPDTPVGLAVDQNGCEINTIFIDPVNLVTVRCPNANIGDTGVLNGKTYTVVGTAAEAFALVDDLDETTCACVSKVTNMSNLFYQNLVLESIEDWDVSSVTRMESMFLGSSSFNQDISNWNVSSVTSMNNMFAGAVTFNQNISNWNVSKVNDMFGMFQTANSFNQDLSNWNVSNVINMSYMFYSAVSFNGDISDWDVSNVINMSYMFGANSIFNQDLSTWNTSNVQNMQGMFSYATLFNQDISNWNVSNVRNMSFMFLEAYNFNFNLANWNTLRVVEMSEMFSNATAYNQDLSGWNVSNVGVCSNFSSGTSSWTQPKPTFVNCTP